MERNEQISINFKVDSGVKESAEAVLTGMGLNMSTYLGMSLRALAQSRKVPFDLEVNPDFWIEDAKAAEAADYVKSGIFADCYGFLSAWSTEAQAILITEVADPVFVKEMDEGNRSAFLRELQALRRSFANDSLDVQKYALERVFRWSLSGATATIDATLDRIGQMLEEEVRAFAAVGFPDLIDSDFASQAKAINGVVDFVIDVYEHNKDQFLLRFVGSESTAIGVEGIIAAIEERAKKAK